MDGTCLELAGKAETSDQPEFEGSLIRRAQRGDRAAFDALVRRYDQEVLRMALRIVQSVEEAQDLYQEAFLKVYRSIGRFRLEAKFSTWLYRVVMNVCLDHLRRQKSRNEAQMPESQHIGDLETAQAFDAFRSVIASLETLYNIHPTAVAADAHPDYLSTSFALRTGLPVIRVQHHYAHVLSCMTENALEGPCLGVAWDGTGYGLDGTVWGGEFLRPTAATFERVAHLRTFRLPGGEQAIKEPRRAAIGLLYELFGDALFSMEEFAPVAAFSPRERGILQGMLARQINTPRTSAAGRLFDAVAAILGLHLGPQFEGQAAMELEWARAGLETDDTYPIRISAEPSTLVLDWEPLVWEVLADARSNMPVARIAARFHNTLVEGILAVAEQVGEERVVLTGGCFQNRYLTERAVARLRAEGFRPYWHQRIPPNDGGIALGQIVAASRVLEEGRCA